MSQFRRPGAEVLRAASGAALKRIRVGGVPEHFNTPWHTALSGGRFEAAGLQVDWTAYPGGTGDMVRALREDELDVAAVLTEGIVTDIHRGNPSKIIGTFVSTPLTWGVYVSSGSKSAAAIRTHFLPLLRPSNSLSSDATCSIALAGGRTSVSSAMRRMPSVGWDPAHT